MKRSKAVQLWNDCCVRRYQDNYDDRGSVVEELTGLGGIAAYKDITVLYNSNAASYQESRLEAAEFLIEWATALRGEKC